MNKEILLNRSAGPSLLKGVNLIADAVKSTLGPGGQNVVIEQENGNIIITKDGVTVAKEIFLSDPVENIGAQMIKQVAEKTVRECGDGTTTSTVLAQAIFTQGMELIEKGGKAMEIKKGIDAAVKVITNELKAMAKPVEGNDILRIATISANNDSGIGHIINDAMNKVGPDGVIMVEEGRTTVTTTRVVEGMQIDRGFLSPHFITDKNKSECVFESALVFVYDQKIDTIKPLIPLLGIAAQAKKPLLIVADSIEGEALAALVVNNTRGAIKVCAISCPGFGETRRPYLEDLAIITGATYITEDQGLKIEEVTFEMLGQCEKIVVNKWLTQLSGGKSDKASLAARAEQIRGEIERSEIDPEIDYLKKRLARLTGGIAMIGVGASSDVEMREKMDRIDDALHATQAAVAEGIVPGGGIALFRSKSDYDELDKIGKEWKGRSVSVSVSSSKESFNDGFNLLILSCNAPLLTILSNMGYDADLQKTIVQELCEGAHGVDYGFNALTEKKENFYQTGVIDPVKVVRLCLENAASVAGLLLTSAVTIHKIKGEWSPLPPPPGMMR